MLAHGGEQLRLFDRVNAQVALQVEIEIEHLRRIAGLFADQLKDEVLHVRRRG